MSEQNTPDMSTSIDPITVEEIPIPVGHVIKATLEAFGIIGTDEVTMMSPANGILSVNHVQMQTPYPPDNERLYVVDETGNWILATDNLYISNKRKQHIDRVWPTSAQLEAHIDHMNGDSTKLNELMFFLAETKKNMPYNEIPPLYQNTINA